MNNNVYLQTYTNELDYQKSSKISMPLESFITYCIYSYCMPEDMKLHLVFTVNTEKEKIISFTQKNLAFAERIPWQVSSCLYPVVMYDNIIITGLCGVARHITKYRTGQQSSKEHEEGLLGFRKSCLQSPNEVSIWTKFCEVDILKTIKEILNVDRLSEIPKNLVRFESHLNKPVRVHNVYKIARDLKKMNIKKLEYTDKDIPLSKYEKKVVTPDKVRTSKPRKWRSISKTDLQIDSSTKIEDLNISHQFAEGPFLTLADIVLFPSYSIMIQIIGFTTLENLLPLTMKWYTNLKKMQEFTSVKNVLNKIEYNPIVIENICVPATDGVSLYKCDPTRHNPKKRLFTKENDIENALNTLHEGMALDIKPHHYELNLNWQDIPDGANPAAGHLPDVRIHRKSQQLENLALAVLSIAKTGDRIVDFCSGSGHLGILVAYLLPNCTVILLENKEQSLFRARTRVQEMNLKNVFFCQCNLDFFVGNFDIGVALHACGIATDLVLDKCLKANAKFVLCPCCYGSLHSTDRLAYPRSQLFKRMNIDQYLCIGHAADQTHEEHPLTVRGAHCMAIIDSDRGRLAEEYGYKVTLSRLKPLTCTPKNNLLVGVPS